jgi:hypothetical protein
MTTSLAVRSSLVDALRLDLVGPEPGSPHADEALPQMPSRLYLTGFLVPRDSEPEQKADETADETVDAQDETGGTDDVTAPEPPAARKGFYPSSIGISVLVESGVTRLRVGVSWGDYVCLEKDEEKGTPHQWKRTPRSEEVVVELPAKTSGPLQLDVPNSNGLCLVATVRPIVFSRLPAGALPVGVKSVSVFLVNERKPAPDARVDEGRVFQTQIELTCEQPFVPRPNLRGGASDDYDERIADLQYRDIAELAVGHGVAAEALCEPGAACSKVRTISIPSAEVERVAPSPMQGVVSGMEELGGLPDAAAARAALFPLVESYRQWIEGQRQHVPSGLTKRQRETADDLLERAEIAARRVEAGIQALADPEVLQAFRIANRCMHAAAMAPARRRADEGKPTWRPFQLAFLLLNLPGIADPTHSDREVVDLLFFPTGGGKTEAYLGLAAVAIVLRRLRSPDRMSGGVSVLMRYTLRLLTLDQLSRAATLICALELERERDEATLGKWHFEIGLWVGQAATPNRMGTVNDRDRKSARARTIAFKNNPQKPSPIPLERCPWCGTKFSPNSFTLVGPIAAPTDLRIVCMDRGCAFTGNRSLPIVAVDEPLYRRLPCFVIATVDKFAAMPWTGEVGKLFGAADRADDKGFYGPCDGAAGARLPGRLLPPDLVIQDELHLISGPLGTMAGLYEAALDELCARKVGEKTVRPKIVASTATVRRAESQIRALFARRMVDVFPPPGPDRRDSFFAHTQPSTESPARSYVGISAPGRSPKVLLLRAYLALLGAAQKAWEADGGEKNPANAADPYMTLVGYFNSLRELGGSRRIVEDEVRNRLQAYATRHRIGEKVGLFLNRKITFDPLELTSRVNTSEVANAKRRLELPFREKERVDVALATNMISVGLDISRLGLMAVLGQPKTTAEYIQATSRVGREVGKPGLVVTLFNIYRPRDRSHYERFSYYHSTFYRNVEATSVTPFSPRALDKGLAGALVGLARLGHTPMTEPRGATEVLNQRRALDFAADAIARRAADQSTLQGKQRDEFAAEVRLRCVDLLDEWERIVHELHNGGVTTQYGNEVGGARPLLRDFLDPELLTLPTNRRKFRANRSLRDVEPQCDLWAKTLKGVEIQEEGAEE